MYCSALPGLRLGRAAQGEVAVLTSRAMLAGGPRDSSSYASCIEIVIRKVANIPKNAPSIQHHEESSGTNSVVKT